MARPAGLEPATYGLEGRCTIRLCYGRRRAVCHSGIHYPSPGRFHFSPSNQWIACMSTCQFSVMLLNANDSSSTTGYPRLRRYQILPTNDAAPAWQAREPAPIDSWVEICHENPYDVKVTNCSWNQRGRLMLVPFHDHMPSQDSV